MSNLIPFQFENNTVRTLVTTDGEVLFIARDVANVLGYKDTADTVSVHCKHAKLLKDIISGKSPDINEINELLRTKSLTIPESDVYRLVMRSRLKSAEVFRDWVVEEVLPAIRDVAILDRTHPLKYLKGVVFQYEPRKT